MDSNTQKLSKLIIKSSKKDDLESEVLVKLYKFFVRQRSEKIKKQEIEKNTKAMESNRDVTQPNDQTTPTATPVREEKKSFIPTALGLLGIVAVGGIFVFSDEIKEKINELKDKLEDFAPIEEEFDKLKALFNFDDLLETLGINEPLTVPSDVIDASQLADVDPSQLNTLLQTDAVAIDESKFKEIQAAHPEIEGDFTSEKARTEAEAFQVADIQKQLGTTDTAQTYSGQKLGVDATKKLYAADKGANAAELLPEQAKANRDLFYDEAGNARSVAGVQSQISKKVSTVKPATQLASREGSVSRKQVYEYLKSKGVDHVHAIGMLANIEGESGFRPGILGDKGTSGGLFQWHDTRLTKLQQAIPDWQTNWKAQIDYALQDKEGNVKDYFGTNYPNAQDATTGWVQYFERPKDPVKASATRRSFVPALEKEVGSGGPSLIDKAKEAFSFSPAKPQPEQTGLSSSELVPIKTASGKQAMVNKAFAPNFQGFVNDLEATGYKINVIAGYSDRNNVNNPSVKSYHALGAAIDINPATNPNKSTKTDMPLETSALAAKWGLGWGMNWKSVKDPMHFSIAKAEQGSVALARGSIAPGEQTGVPTGSVPTSQLASAPNDTPSIPEKQEEEDTLTADTFIVKIEQSINAIQSFSKNVATAYNDARPQDVMRGYYPSRG